jgi:hypothetical protein
VRVLVAVEPLMYRETIASVLLQRRPHTQVRIAGPEDLDREVESFLPHLVVCNVLSEKVKGSAISWVHILYEDSLAADVSVDERTTRRIDDMGLDDLFGVLDETEELIPPA